MKWNTKPNIKSNIKSTMQSSRKVKQDFSNVWELIGNHTINGILGFSLVLILLQGGLFFYLGMNQGEMPVPFYTWIDHKLVRYSFIAAVMAVCNLSASVCANKKVGYTMNRLGISRKTLFAVWTFHSVCMILIIWGVQVAIFFVASKYYQYLTPENMVAIQTFYLSTFRSEFFHIVLPLEEGLLWIRNILLWLCMASGSAYYAMKRFQGVQSMVYGVTTFLAFVHFLSGSGMANYYMIPFMCFILAFMVYGGIIDEGKYNE